MRKLIDAFLDFFEGALLFIMAVCLAAMVFGPVIMMLGWCER